MEMQETLGKLESKEDARGLSIKDSKVESKNLGIDGVLALERES